jgi:hypothetical protein
MKVCKYCGRDNDDAALHCCECGSEWQSPVIRQRLSFSKMKTSLKRLCKSKKLRFFAILVAVMALPVGRRIDWIDLDALYSDCTHQNGSFIPGYEANSYAYKGRGVIVVCFLAGIDDFRIGDGFVRRSPNHPPDGYPPISVTSAHFGDEAHHAMDGSNLPELDFSRWNIHVIVDRPSHTERGPSASVEQREFEEMAIRLDNAIIHHAPTVRIKYVSLGSYLLNQISKKVRELLFLWMLYRGKIHTQ